MIDPQQPERQPNRGVEFTPGEAGARDPHGIDPHGIDAHWAELSTLVTRAERNRADMSRLQAERAEVCAEALDLIARRVAQREAARVGVRGELGDAIPLREVLAELSAALRVGERTVSIWLGDASALVGTYRATLAALREGRIDERHASAIIDAGAALAPERRTEYESLILPIAETDTAPGTRAMARIIAARLQPDIVDENRRRAFDERCVRMFDLGDGLSRLLLDGPAALIHGIYDRLTQMGAAQGQIDRAGEFADAATDASRGADADADASAGADADDTASAAATATADATAGADADAAAATGAGAESLDRAREHAPSVPDEPDALEDPAVPSVPDAPDERSLDQRRADIMTDLLLTSTPALDGDSGLGAIRATVQITVPILTLARHGDDPALLDGEAPVDADTARLLAATSPCWQRVMTHPVTAEPLRLDTYRPSKRLRRLLGARDRHCRWPGCRRPARSCDLDHTVAWEDGGSTCLGNLAALCPRHHTLKHASGWRVVQVGGGTLDFTSPTGRTYRNNAPPVILATTLEAAVRPPWAHLLHVPYETADPAPF